MGMPIRRFPSDDGAPQPKRRRSSLLSSQSPSSQSPSPAPDSDATDSVGDFTVMEMASRIISAQVNAANSINNANPNSTDSLLPSLLSSPTRRIPTSRRVFVLPRGRRGSIADAFAGVGEADNDGNNENDNDNSNNNSNSTIDISDSDDVTTDTEVLYRYQRRLRPRRRRWPRASILPHDLARNNTNITSTMNMHGSDDHLNSRQRSTAISMSRANGLDLSAVSQVSVFYSGRISQTAAGSPSLKGSLHLCKTHRHESNDAISALSVVYTDIEPVSVDIPNWWLIGTWPIHDGNVSAQTVFQLLMDVLHESGSIPSVVIAYLLVCDDLHTVPGVLQAISMLKRGGHRNNQNNNGRVNPLIDSSPAARRLTQRLRLRQRYSSEALDSAAVLAQLNHGSASVEPIARGMLSDLGDNNNDSGWPESFRVRLTNLQPRRQDVGGTDGADGHQDVEGTFLHPVTGDSVSVCVE